MLILQGFALLLLVTCEVLAEEKVIHAGDVIEVTVLGSPELSRTLHVKANGTTDYPILLSSSISGLTIKELNQLLTPLISKYIEKPVIYVTISEYIMLRILGEVRNPGIIQATGLTGLQGAIALAGGTTSNADLRNIAITRAVGDSTYELKIDLIRNDNYAALTTTVKSNDVIVVPSLTSASYVSVLGAVSMPGLRFPSPGMTLLDIIYAAGGPTPKADMEDVTHISSSNGSYLVKKYRMRSIIESQSTKDLPQVYPGDIVIVRAYAPWETWDFWAQALRDFTYFISVYVLLR